MLLARPSCGWHPRAGDGRFRPPIRCRIVLCVADVWVVAPEGECGALASESAYLTSVTRHPGRPPQMPPRTRAARHYKRGRGVRPHGRVDGRSENAVRSSPFSPALTPKQTTLRALGHSAAPPQIYVHNDRPSPPVVLSGELTVISKTYDAYSSVSAELSRAHR